MVRIFVGYDERESLAYRACVNSLHGMASAPFHVEPLRADRLRRAGLYWRCYDEHDGQRVDWSDGRPFSTDFTYTRFLVPALCQWLGVALFCDSDFMWRRDVSLLLKQYDPRYAVQVVKHDHRPPEKVKMRGQAQAVYPRKNWSSLMLWNCEHPANSGLTPDVVNMREGRWLHRFGWLDDDQIGGLAPEWNWLEGEAGDLDPAAVHYTRGTPDMHGHHDAPFADEWRRWAA